MSAHEDWLPEWFWDGPPPSNPPKAPLSEWVKRRTQPLDPDLRAKAKSMAFTMAYAWGGTGQATPMFSDMEPSFVTTPADQPPPLHDEVTYTLPPELKALLAKPTSPPSLPPKEKKMPAHLSLDIDYSAIEMQLIDALLQGKKEDETNT